MSLRVKYLLVASLSVLAPLLVYLLTDVFLTRRVLVRDQAEALRLASDMVAGALTGCEDGCPERARGILARLAVARPELEVMLIDPSRRIVASTRGDMVGRVWQEPGIDQVLDGSRPYSWATMEHHGEPVLDVTVPWQGADGAARGVIHLARTLASVNAYVLDIQVRHGLFVVLVALMVGGLLSLMTYRYVIRRLGRLDHELRDIELGAEASPSGAGDEIDHVAAALHALVRDLRSTAARLEASLAEREALLARVESFNEELEAEVRRVRDELLTAQQDLLRAEQLAVMGHLSAGMAHELRNPLFIMRGTAEALGRRHPESEEDARDIIQEVDRVNDIISRLLDLARPVTIERRPVALKAFVRDCVEGLARAGRLECAASLRVDGPDDLEVQGDAGYLRQAFMNLLLNACEAAQSGDGVQVEIARAESGEAMVRVCDDGPGVAPEDRDELFRPFFTKKPGGTGLGLTLTRKFLDVHGATVEVASTPGEGACFTVRFPAEQEPEP